MYEWTILIEGEDTPITFKSQDGSVKEGREIGVYKGHNGEYVWRVIPNLSPDDHLFE